jgi:dienelactone hydrolase
MPTFIEDPDFNDQLGRTLTAAARGGADLGEALAIAERIAPGDLVSWYDAWLSGAQQAHAAADNSRRAGDRVSAHHGYLRASEYYRQATFFARTTLTDPRLHRAYQAHRATFRSAMELAPHTTTVVSITQQDVEVRGYLFSPDDSGRPRATVLAPAGYDSTAEAGYTFSAISALERDMNCLVFEGPGQGGVLYELGIPLRHDFEAVLTPVVDWLLEQVGVDPEALVLVGRSFAGYLAPRAATREHRLAALVCDPAQYDFGAAIRKKTGEETWQRLMADDATLDADLEPLMSTPLERNGFEWRMAAHGTRTLRAYFRELSRFNLTGMADQISCPTLALAGEGDFAGTGQLHVFAQALTATVSTHEFTKLEGAGGHCEGLGQDLFDQVVYGWLARQLPPADTATSPSPALGSERF